MRFLICQTQKQQLQSSYIKTLMIEFKFPEEMTSYQEIQSSKQLNEMLKSEASARKLRVNYRIKISKSIYLYAKCTLCSCQLSYYKKSDGTYFMLKKCTSEHRHDLKDKGHHKRIQNLIRDLPDSLTMKSAKSIFFHQIKEASLSQFYYYFSKVKQPSLKFQELVEILDKNRCEIMFQGSQDQKAFPRLFLVVTQEMKRLYQRYGEFMSFDMTFNIVKDPKSSRTWKLGAFLGLSKSKRIVPFGLTLSQSLTAQDYYKIFSSFSQIMSGLPAAIVTDQQFAVESALKMMKDQGKWNGYHTQDNFHILRNVRKKLKIKENIKYFSTLAKSQNQYDFQKNLSNTYGAFDENQLGILKKFVQQSQRYCFSNLPSTFIGFSSSSSRNEKFHDILKTHLPFQTSFSKSVQKTLQVLNILAQKCDCFTIQKLPIQKYFGLPELKQLRFSLDSSIFGQFCKQLSKTIYLQIITENQEKIVIRQAQNNQQFFVDYNSFACSCKFRNKTGIGCSHAIKSALFKKTRLIKLIDPRWLIQNQNKINRKKRVGFKKSRRNRGL